jgi:hypothetical protein
MLLSLGKTMQLIPWLNLKDVLASLSCDKGSL